MVAPKRIIVVGQAHEASRTRQRIAAMRARGHDVRLVPTTVAAWSYESKPTVSARLRHRLRIPGDPAGANAALLHALAEGADLVWLDAAPMIRPATLKRAKMHAPNVKIIWYGEDDMMNPVHRSVWLDKSLALFDLWLTTKSFNADPQEMPSRGLSKVLFVNNRCDPGLHRPIDIGPEERTAFGAPISFIGTFEEPRANSLLHLAEHGFRVRVWGNGWRAWAGRHANLNIEDRPVYNDDFARVVAASDINLCFLRKFNRDLQTCRSVEIPACAGFMVHERNPQITALFRERREAAYFSTDEDLGRVCADWLGRAERRRDIGSAARRRVLALGLTHETMIDEALAALDVRAGEDE